MKRPVRYLCLVVGVIATALGIIGTVVPMWPTTPFLLLAAACFVRSSDRLYAWLVGHAHLGPYVRDFMSRRGIPLRAKRVTLTLMWVTSQMSWLVILWRVGLRPWTIAYAVLLICVAIGVHYYIGYRVPTRKEVEQDGPEKGPVEARSDRARALAAATDIHGMRRCE